MVTQKKVAHPHLRRIDPLYNKGTKRSRDYTQIKTHPLAQRIYVDL